MMESIPEDNMFYKFAEHVWMEAQKERWRHTTPMLLVTISTEERYRKMDEYINGICSEYGFCWNLNYNPDKPENGEHFYVFDRPLFVHRFMEWDRE